MQCLGQATDANVVRTSICPQVERTITSHSLRIFSILADKQDQSAEVPLLKF